MLAVGAFALPLFILWNTSDTYILPKLLLARLLVVVLAALWLIGAALRGRVSIKRTPVDLFLAAFIASAGLSTLLSINRNVALFGTYIRYEGLLTVGLYGALFWLTAQSLDGPADARRLLRLLLAAGYVASLFAIVDAVLGSAHGVGGAESAFTFGGLQRAEGPFGNPNLLATFLAMLLPLALHETLTADHRLTRLCWLNVLLVMTLALLFTFGRGSWIGAAIGVAIMAVAQARPWRRGRRFLVSLAGALLIPGMVALLVLNVHGGLPLSRSVLARAASIANPAAGSAVTRLHVWHDALRLIASRPLLGYGPDTFGLVYPHFQSGDWTPGYRVDKAHADLLQVASTQGLPGVGAYLGIQFGVLATFWRARRRPAALPLFAAWVAYEVPMQVNFSWLPATAPFWIFLGAAMVCCRDRELPIVISARRRRVTPLAAGAAAALLLTLTVPAVVVPYIADQRFATGLAAELHGETAAARSAVTDAHRLSPENNVYAVEQANLDLRSGNLSAARRAYEDAIELGTADPSAYRSLSVIDELTGRRDEAIRAAAGAEQLEPFNPANRNLLNQLTAQVTTR